MTFPSDRVTAIDGIIEEMRKERSDDFNKYGVWEDELTEQLLWRSLNNPRQEAAIPSFPSWSWAVTGGEKLWISNRVICQSISTTTLTDSGTLRASAPLLRARVAEHAVPYCCIKALRGRTSTTNDKIILFGLDIQMLSVIAYESKQSFLLLDVDESAEVLGIAVFDDERPRFLEVLCLVLVSANRGKHDIWCVGDKLAPSTRYREHFN